jgi:DNA-binding PadR family transcriptional regulator
MNDLLLLALLLDGAKHGYALKKQAGFFSGSPEMHNNLVYPLLRRFVKQGWVRKKETADERGQTRVVYSLTEAGREELVRRLGEFGEAEARSAEAFHLRVGLFEVLGRERREKILEQRRNYLAAREQRMEALERGMDVGKFGGEVVRFLRRGIRAELQWIEQLRRASGAPKERNVGRRKRERR